jgi:hypothetical protein
MLAYAVSMLKDTQASSSLRDSVTPPVAAEALLADRAVRAMEMQGYYILSFVEEAEVGQCSRGGECG